MGAAAWKIRPPHPFSRDELKKVVGEPQFPRGAKFSLEKCLVEKPGKSQSDEAALIGAGDEYDDGKATKAGEMQPVVRLRIPLANGNPDSRVYAYEVVVVGEAGSQKLFKAVYAAGCNMGIGHETNGGVTTLEIAKDELPPGKSLTFAVRPLTSLGTSGRPIITDFKV